MSVQRFLDWFEGFSDNLEGAPDDEQWDKIKARIFALRDCAEPVYAPQAAAQTQATQHPGGQHTVERFRGLVLDWLMDNDETSLDRETAINEMRGLIITRDHLNMEPGEVGASILRRMGH